MDIGIRKRLSKNIKKVCLATSLIFSIPFLYANPHYLDQTDILIHGLALKVDPPEQTLPKNIATIVSVYLQAPTAPTVPPFDPNATVKATLRGPSYPEGYPLTTKANTPFQIPALPVFGLHTLEDIRLVDGDDNILLRGSPEHATLNVIEKLLVTQVTARPLTAEEIREKGIVYDASSFQAFNFTAAFAINNQPIQINFPVLLPVLPDLNTASSINDISLPDMLLPNLPKMETLIPDTLKLQTQIPNLSIIGFSFEAPMLQNKPLNVPPIPGVIIIPGDIGFLNQFFSVMLMVGNVAPSGSNLVVSDLKATLSLPPGYDGVLFTDDDPLRMATTVTKENSVVQNVTQPGPDGKSGTADDILTVGPGESGISEYLIEGLREGSHALSIDIAGTLNGLPVGPVDIHGKALGSVLVRNPKFTLTFTHPDVVNAGEIYKLDVTVVNTSEAPANAISVNLFSANISGATLLGSPSRTIETIAPGDSAMMSFDLISRRTGRIFAATLDSDQNISGRFALKTSVGELGIPLSPDSLVLPKQADALPSNLREAALGLLGIAYAAATSPPGVLAKNIQPFSKKIVIDRSIQLAQAGFRLSLKESLRDSVAHLWMDYLGNDLTKLSLLFPKPEDEAWERRNIEGFDALRRSSIRGDLFGNSIGAILGADLSSLGLGDFHFDVAQKWSFRTPHISILIKKTGEKLPYRISITDERGNVLGDVDESGKIIKNIAFSDHVSIPIDSKLSAQMMTLAVPSTGTYSITLTPIDEESLNSPYSLSVIAPDREGHLKQFLYESLTKESRPLPLYDSSDPYQFTFSFRGPSPSITSPVTPSTRSVPQNNLSVIGVSQQSQADVLSCNKDAEPLPVGRIMAVLFNQEIDKTYAENIENYSIENNTVIAAALQHDKRTVFLAARNPLGPFIERSLDIDGLGSSPIEISLDDQAVVVSGRVLNADGTPVPMASVVFSYFLACDGLTDSSRWAGIGMTHADENGHYSFDYITRKRPTRLVATNPSTGETQSLQFSSHRDSQRLNVDIVFLGRGTVAGYTRYETGEHLKDTVIRVTSLLDSSVYGAISDENGRFEISRVPVGNIFIEAVNEKKLAKMTLSENIPHAGAFVFRDITLLGINLGQSSVTVKRTDVDGFVYRSDGLTPVPAVPVIAYYTSLSQPGVPCDGDCPVAITHTKPDGSFSFEDIVSGHLRLHSFDQAALQEGSVRIVAGETTTKANILLTGGLATVRGIVVDPHGYPVAGARVGGGLSISSTGIDGMFLLNDVPIGRRDIVAVSDALQTQGRTTIDISRPGEEVFTTVVLSGRGSIAGQIRKSDGTPASEVNVVLMRKSIFWDWGKEKYSVEVFGRTKTDANGRYIFRALELGAYEVTAFSSNFNEGNITPVGINYHNQVSRGDLTFRGSGGRVNGTIFGRDGITPLKAYVGLTGDQPVVVQDPEKKFPPFAIAFQRVQNHKQVESDLKTGKFSFSGLWVGTSQITAAGPFSPTPIVSEVNIKEPNEVQNITMQLEPTSQIRGTVLMPDGVSTAGQNIIVRFNSQAVRIECDTDILGDAVCREIPQGIQNTSAVTDALGRYWFPLVTPGAYSLSVEDVATGKVGFSRGSVSAGEKAEVDIRLLATGAIKVSVKSSDAVTPISGARVEINQLSQPWQTKILFADDQGQIIFSGADGFSEGDFVVNAKNLNNGFTGRGQGKLTLDGSTVSINVYLYDAVGSIYGKVFRSDGITPVPNSQVIVNHEQGPLAWSVTDTQGAFRVESIPLGTVNIDSFNPYNGRQGYASGRIDLPNQEVPINIQELGLGLVNATALDSDDLSPLKGWSAQLVPQTPFGRILPSLRATTGLDGRVNFPGTSEGNFSVSINKHNHQGSASAQGSIRRDGDVLEIPLLIRQIKPLFGRVAGTVFNPDGLPAANSEVEICCTENSQKAVVTADSDGLFFLDNVALGRVSLTAHSQTTPNRGHSLAEITHPGEEINVNIVMVGVATVSGIVVKNDDTPAIGVKVSLTGQPSSGCAGPCQIFTGTDGRFIFHDIPARTFTLNAIDPIINLKGAAGGTLNPGEEKNLRIVLEPSASLSGKVLFSNGFPAGSMSLELKLTQGTNTRFFYMETTPEGNFQFEVVPLGEYTLTITDPIGSGFAQKQGSIIDDINFGDIILDEAPPMVATIAPLQDSLNVSLNSAIEITFTEPINPASLNSTNLVLASTNGIVTTAMTISEGDTKVTLTPVAPLKDSTIYTLRVKDLRDRVAKKMESDFVSKFTTLDQTPPHIVELTPNSGQTGVTIDSVIRIRYSEPIDPGGFLATPITLTTATGEIPGRIDFIQGNTVIVFTPFAPLKPNNAYQVHITNAVDWVGNRQSSEVNAFFSTTNLEPPDAITLTTISPVVIENTTATVMATAMNPDIAYFDFFINGVFSATLNRSPYVFSFNANPSLGKPGDSIVISAVATNTSGIKSGTASSTIIQVIPDALPVINITTPINGTTFKNGDSVLVNLQAQDDLGISQLSFKAHTGQPQNAGARNYVSPLQEQEQIFLFTIPSTLAPGANIIVEAKAIDTKGQTSISSITINIEDATPPTIQVSNIFSGQQALPGQLINFVISSQDPGGVREIGFALSGAGVASSSRTINPPEISAAASFSFTLSSSAISGDTARLRAYAIDQEGNRADSAEMIITIADSKPPLVRLWTNNGRLDMPIGAPLQIIVEADDNSQISHLELSAHGAFEYSNTIAISPPVATARRTFSLTVPSFIAPGSTTTFIASAKDTAENMGTSPSLTLKASSIAGVTLPTSLLFDADENKTVLLELSEPAGPEGSRVDLAVDHAHIVSLPAFVSIEPGQSTASFTLSGIAAGTTFVTATIDGSPRGTMTVVIRGGIVKGIVRNELLVPIPGAQVTITGGVVKSTITDSEGRYRLIEIPGPAIDVKVYDPVTHYRAHATGNMARAWGTITLNPILIPAGGITGQVVLADGVSPAGSHIQVKAFHPSDLASPLQTVFTQELGTFEFPLATPGEYLIEASDTDGRRGRSLATILATGDSPTVTVVFLGRGQVNGVILDGGDKPVPNALFTFINTSLFGSTVINGNTNADGTFLFENVLVGNFTLQATDPITKQGGSISGFINTDEEIVTKSLKLSTYGTLRGIITKADKITPVADAAVRINNFIVYSDETGHYNFQILPLGQHLIQVNHPGTRGIGKSQVNLLTHEEILTQNINLFAQGSLAVTVLNDQGSPAANASLSVQISSAGMTDSLSAKTSADGTAALVQLLSGFFTISASANGVSISSTGFLEPDQVHPVNLKLPAVVTVPGVPKSTATVYGLVLMADGQPARGGSVKSNSLFFGAIDVNGQYRIEGVPAAANYSYEYTVYDEKGRKRAKPQTVKSEAPGQYEANFQFIPLGTLTGRVVNPNGTSASNVNVQIYASSYLGGFRSAVTNSAGFYESHNFPGGPFTVRVVDPNKLLYGDNTGVLVREEEIVTADIQLTGNAIVLPVNRRDANGFIYDINLNGAMTGPGNINSFSKAMIPSISVNGVNHVFTGGTFGSLEHNGRQIVVRQLLADINHTRKIYIPEDGYFARTLETYTNTSTSTLTMDVILNGEFRAKNMDTSSENHINFLNRDDRWVTLYTGTASTNTYRIEGTPDLALVFGAPDDSEFKGIDVDAADISFTHLYSNLTTRWNNIEIPAGNSISILHFAAQTHHRMGARFAAERLSELPPEALFGLSAEEMAQIRNFKVPDNGISKLATLPKLNAIIVGRVYEVDHITPISNATVVYKSSHPLFAQTLTVKTDSQGMFRLTGNTQNETSRPIPIAPFTLHAVHTTGAISPELNSDFQAHQEAALLDIVFSNTALVKGLVKRHSHTIVTQGTIRLRNPLKLFDQTTTIQSDGAFQFSGVPSGDNYEFIASLPHLQGTSLQGTSIQSINNGLMENIQVFMHPTGHLRGLVRRSNGERVISAPVTLGRENFSRNTITDSGGHFIFPETPAGSFILKTVDPASAIPVQIPVDIAPDVTTDQDITVAPLGSIELQVNFDRGSPAANANVQFQQFARDSLFRSVGVTDANGRITIDKVALSSFTIRFSHPDDSSFVVSLSSELVSNTDPFLLQGTLPVVGSIEGNVMYANGSPATNMNVSIQSQNPEMPTKTLKTDLAGRFFLKAILAGNFTASINIQSGISGMASGIIEHDGVTVNTTIKISTNSVSFPQYRYDGNTFSHTIRQDGTISADFSWSRYFTSNDSISLEIIKDNAAQKFTGRNVGYEQGNRELGIRQEELFGLHVTRRVFIPQNGYFIRYIEEFYNPTDSPITVSARINTTVAGRSSNPIIMHTSSGDNILSTGSINSDNWLVIDDSTDEYPFNINTMPPAAIVWGGQGGAIHIDTITHDTIAYPNANPAQIRYQWSNIVIEPNKTAALLHFTVQQLSLNSAKVAAERLVQLPPEALDGMGPLESQNIKNFIIPSDGSSHLEPLPTFNNRIEGSVFNNDEEKSPVPGATVYFKSLHPLFGRLHTKQLTVSAPDSNFEFESLITNYGWETVLIPRYDFSIYASHPKTRVLSPILTGHFDVEGSSIAVKNIAFSNLGTIEGHVKFSNGFPASKAKITAILNESVNVITADNNGFFQIQGLAPAVYKLKVETTFNSSEKNNIAVIPGTSTITELIIPASSLEGFVKFPSGSPAVGYLISVQFLNNNQYQHIEAATTDENGYFIIHGLKHNTQTSITIKNPTKSAHSLSKSIYLPQDSIATAIIEIPSLAPIYLQVIDSRGSPVFNSLVTLAEGNFGIYFDTVGRTDHAGQLIIPQVLVENATVRVYFPGADNSPYAFRSHAVAVQTETPLSLTIAIPDYGFIAGVARSEDGQILSNAAIVFKSNTPGSEQIMTYSNQMGLFNFSHLSTGAFTLIGFHSSQNLFAENFSEHIVHGLTKSIELVFKAPGIQLPQPFYDGNNFKLNMEMNGSISDSFNTYFQMYPIEDRGGSQLHLTRDGIKLPFSGLPFAKLSENRREVAIQQFDLHGLHVTRKVYIPSDGYFIRTIEKLHNPNTTPLTIDISVTTKLNNASMESYEARTKARLELMETSNGNKILNHEPENADQWAIIADNLYSRNTTDYQFLLLNVPPFISVFDGLGAKQSINNSNFQILNSSLNVSLGYSWENVTIPPGETVAYMHFEAMQTHINSAIDTARHLVKLPQEAIDGIPAEDRNIIQNFSIPLDGISAIAAPPLIAGKIHGHFYENYENYGKLPISGTIRIMSENPLFSAPIKTGTDENGYFSFLSTITSEGSVIFSSGPGFIAGSMSPTYIPLIPPLMPTTFYIELTEDPFNIEMEILDNDYSLITGTVKDFNGIPLKNVRVQYRNINNSINGWLLTDSKGEYLLRRLSPSTYTIQCIYPIDETRTITLSSQVVTTAGKGTVVNFSAQQPSSLFGKVTTEKGIPLSNVYIYVTPINSINGFSTVTDMNGNFTFNEIPGDIYTIDLHTQDYKHYHTSELVIPPGENVEKNFTFPITTPIVNINLVYSDGTTITNAFVSVYRGILNEKDFDFYVEPEEEFYETPATLIWDSYDPITIFVTHYVEGFDITKLVTVEFTEDDDVVNVSIVMKRVLYTPNLTGLSISDAITELTSMGLVADPIYIPHLTIGKNIIFQQNPSSNEPVLEGSSIQLMVSLGPPAGTRLSGQITGQLSLAQSPYVVLSDINIPLGQTVTIEPGVIIKFAYSKGMNVYGTLISSGTMAQPIIFTSIHDDIGNDAGNDGISFGAPGQWGQLKFFNGSALSSISNTIIRFGEQINLSNSSLEFSDTLIASMSIRAIGIDSYSSPRGKNIIVEGCGINGIEYVSDSIITNPVKWNDLGIPYVIREKLLKFDGPTYSYPGEGSLMLEPGVVIKFKGNYPQYDYGLYTFRDLESRDYYEWSDPISFIENYQPAGLLFRQSQIQANGTNERPIIFTSLYDDSVLGDTNNDGNATTAQEGDWSFVGLWNYGPYNIKHIQLKYAGDITFRNGNSFILERGNLNLDNVLLENNLNSFEFTISTVIINNFISRNSGEINIRYLNIVSLTNADIKSNSYTGMTIESSNLIAENIMLEASNRGLYVFNRANVNISQSKIINNSEYGIFNVNSLSTVTAVYNYWGSDTGPQHPSNPGGLGDRVSDHVTFIPFLTSSPFDDEEENEEMASLMMTDNLSLTTHNDTGANLLNTNKTAAPTELSILYGTILAGDGKTPIEKAEISIHDDQHGYAITALSSTDGTFICEGPFSTGDLLSITAVSPINKQASVTQTITWEPRLNKTHLTLTLPLPVLEGHVTYRYQESSIKNVMVFLEQKDDKGEPSIQHFNTKNQKFRFIGRGLGLSQIIAHDVDSGLVLISTKEITNLTTTNRVDMAFPFSGRVKGIFLDTENRPLGNAYVTATSNELAFDRITKTNKNGEFQFDHMEKGEVGVQACIQNNAQNTLCGSTYGNLTSDKEDLSLIVKLPAQPALSINTHKPGLNLTIKNLDTAGPQGTPHTHVLGLPDQSLFEINTSAGHSLLEIKDPVTYELGLWETNINNENHLINISLGNAASTQFGFALSNQKNNSIEIKCDASIQFNEMPYGRLSIQPHALFPCVDSARSNQEGREYLIGPKVIQGLKVSRSVYIPQDDIFVRFVESIENPTNSERTITLEVSSNPGWATVRGSTWTVTIPPQQTVNILHFAWPLTAENKALTENLGNSLKTLTNKNALLGLSENQIQNIRNFNIP
jgi:protocatechuate 3,4-dioxygenase beta subunit